MRILDPTYLRYVYDGFQKGAISNENPSVLPNGLVGVFEEAFLNSTTVSNRSKLLEFFSVWALLKKEVSASFILPLLPGWTEEQTLECIAQYSKWFNSPISGKYQIYHERLKTFVLQKGSAEEFTKYNEKVIKICREALASKSNDEWDIYALEHLSTYLLVPAMEGLDSESLKTLAYDTAHWKRQIYISKGYDWTKKMHNELILWASKYDDEQVIECALNKIDLYHMEQNDAPRIVELVANNDMETALQRIENFGGKDKVGLQRKFILYMLCLMELTLLGSKDQPFRREAIEKLLRNLDEHIPVDHSVLNWDEFFPSYLIFLMASEWVKMGLPCKEVYMRAEPIEKEWLPSNEPSRADFMVNEWLSEKGPYSDEEFDILLMIANGINDFDYKNEAVLSDIYVEMAKQEKLEKAIQGARGFTINEIKYKTLFKICYILYEQENEEFENVIEEYVKCLSWIDDDVEKCSAILQLVRFLFKNEAFDESSKLIEDVLQASSVYEKDDMCITLANISTLLAEQGKFEESKNVLKETLKSVQEINDEWEKNNALRDISLQMAKQKKFNDAVDCTLEISSDDIKSYAQCDISIEMVKYGQLNDALEFVHGISNKYGKSQALSIISPEIARQGKLDKAIEIAQLCSIQHHKNKALSMIYNGIVKQGDINTVFVLLLNNIEFSNMDSDDFNLNECLYEICTELANQSKIENSLEIISFINDIETKSDALFELSIKLADDGKVEDSSSMLQEAIKLVQCINVNLGSMSRKLAKQGKFKESLEIMLLISDGYFKDSTLIDISAELSKQSNFEEAIKLTQGISDMMMKNDALIEISKVLSENGKIEEWETLIQEMILFAGEIINENDKFKVLLDISTELSKQGKINEGASLLMESLSIALGIFNVKEKYSALIIISKEISKLGKFDEALELTFSINNQYQKDEALKGISDELSKQLDFKLSLEIANSINNESIKSEALSVIAMDMSIHGKFENAYEVANLIYRENTKVETLLSISSEMQKRLMIFEASNLLKEVLEYLRESFFDKMKISMLGETASEFSKHGNWDMVEKAFFMMPGAYREYYWGILTSKMVETNGWQITLEHSQKLQNVAAREFYLKGWTKAIKLNDINKSLIKQAMFIFKNNSVNIKRVLQLYAQHELFFAKPSKEKINRLNKTLNIQWAIDIVANFPKEENLLRLSTNLSDWIDQIQDEDDRDQISLWAKQARKGKISESEFEKKIKEFN